MRLGSVPAPFVSSSSNGLTQAKLTGAQEAIAGATAGFFARIAVAPIDLAKIRLQLQRHPVSDLIDRAGSTSAVFIRPPKYTGMWQTLRTVAREEGVPALWKGNVPAQLMVFPISSP